MATKKAADKKGLTVTELAKATKKIIRWRKQAKELR